MLQSHSDSVETRASWAVASVALAILGMSFGAAWITAVALKDIAAEVGGARSDPGARQFAGVARLRRRRHHHVTGRRSGRHALDGDIGLADDRPWPLDFDLRAALAAVDRPRTVYRPDRNRRHQCALVHLCQPLVRPPARLGAGADLERHLSRRRDVAADVRAGDRQFRLAAGDAVVRARRDHRRRAACRDLFPRAARSDSSAGGVRSRPDQSARARLAAQCRVRVDVRAPA